VLANRNAIEAVNPYPPLRLRVHLRLTQLALRQGVRRNDLAYVSIKKFWDATAGPGS
jgi:hypothetical protein